MMYAVRIAMLVLLLQMRDIFSYHAGSSSKKAMVHNIHLYMAVWLVTSL